LTRAQWAAVLGFIAGMFAGGAIVLYVALEHDRLRPTCPGPVRAAPMPTAPPSGGLWREHNGEYDA
jgi:hypothetical protein